MGPMIIYIVIFNSKLVKKFIYYILGQLFY